MKTIIQTIGPLYGDVVNGTVFGQPNGSEARPPPNVAATINLSASSGELVYDQVLPSGEIKYALNNVLVGYTSPTPATIYYRATNAANDLVAYGTGTDLKGAVENKPTDGDSITLVAELHDSNNNITITSGTVTVTAEVSS